MFKPYTHSISALLLFLALTAYGQQQERVAIINTVDDRDSIEFSDLNYLTVKLRETAVNVLPKSRYIVMSMQSIVDFLGSEERAIKECKAASCLAELGRKVSADYVAQARIGRFNKNLTIGVELYNSKNGAMVGSFTGDSKSLPGLLTIINEKAPFLFKELPSTSSSSNVASPVVPPTPTSTPIPAPTQPAAVVYGQQLTDSRDGKKYKTVVIGNQTWMAENLNYNAKGSKCYDNKPVNCDKYGRLYDWNMAMKACPKGWHLPSDKDWNVLMKFVNPSCSNNKICYNAGTKLKATSGWDDYKGKYNGTDEYGFAALPGGSGYSGRGFDNVGRHGHWWSSSEFDANDAYHPSMSFLAEEVYRHKDNLSKYSLYSVRCLQD